VAGRGYGISSGNAQTFGLRYWRTVKEISGRQAETRIWDLKCEVGVPTIEISNDLLSYFHSYLM
jgi:hypothetical protein